MHPTHTHTVALAKAHGPPGWVEAYANVTRSPDGVVQLDVVGIYVVVVGRGGASREDKLRHGTLGANVDVCALHRSRGAWGREGWHMHEIVAAST